MAQPALKIKCAYSFDYLNFKKCNKQTYVKIIMSKGHGDKGGRLIECSCEQQYKEFIKQQNID